MGGEKDCITDEDKSLKVETVILMKRHVVISLDLTPLLFLVKFV